MARIVPVAHDFVCEWCWIGIFQARRMRREFGVQLDWRPYELFPPGLQDDYAPEPPPPADKPLTPSRLTLAFAAANITPVKRPLVPTGNAHQAVEFLKSKGIPPDAFIERVYFAYWKEGADISDVHVLLELAKIYGVDPNEMTAAICENRFETNIVRFNEQAYATGVYNLPTFWIGGDRFAEQPWFRLEAALRKEFGSPEIESISTYSALDYSIQDAPKSRPYCVINMVSTIDGKTITGKRGEPVHDLGSELDHFLMRRIQDSVEAVMLGAASQRSTPGITYPSHLLRFVVTRSGRLLWKSRFFEDDPAKAYVICPVNCRLDDAPESLRILRCGDSEVDLQKALGILRADFGIRRLLVEGGSALNAQLFKIDVVDELFLTIAPKIKLGGDVPTIADGTALERDQIMQFDLIEEIRHDNEVFLRYRRKRSGA